MKHLACIASLLFAFSLTAARAEDGYDLWLRYSPVEDAYSARYRATAAELVSGGASPTLDAAKDELARGLSGLLNRPEPLSDHVTRDGALLIGTPKSSPAIAALNLDLGGAGEEGYVIRSVRVQGHSATAIAANSDVGVLYGAFAYLRLLQTRRPVAHLAIVSAPKIKIRMLDHWDAIGGRGAPRRAVPFGLAIGTGYAGRSIFKWDELPGKRDPRYTDYARANASIGINGAAVNALDGDPRILTADYIAKAAVLADIFRPFGIKVYFSVSTAAPLRPGGLKTADPLDPAVAQWWKDKADEIYRAIPDFGGFLIKAASEGQPGPQQYGRSHADGANVMARALKPHGGIVMWRAFVYAAENPEDRARQAYDEFKPLDGQFDGNVAVQVKNGPIDFQPREPFSPLFGAVPKTNVFMEFQITKEYLGHATHLAYLGTMWSEALQADTYAKGKGSTVARVVDGGLFGNRLTGIAGVANIGDSRNWCGSVFNQANWYAFGRLAWDPDMSPRVIAGEWTRQTLGNDRQVVDASVRMMMASREAVVNYMTPLGLNMIMEHTSHFGPMPWDEMGDRPDWKAPYYHHADAAGLGYDRTRTGSNALAQYFPQAAAKFEDMKKLDFLVWFHHVPWAQRLSTGRTFWDELVVRYGSGVDAVVRMRKDWTALKDKIDPDRWALTAHDLSIQQAEALWWRDGGLAYWQSFSKMPYPQGYSPPPFPLSWYEAKDPMAPLPAYYAAMVEKNRT
jgi:alpha-glucuronidase